MLNAIFADADKQGSLEPYRKTLRMLVTGGQIAC
jgi:hypothetical protein